MQIRERPWKKFSKTLLQEEAYRASWGGIAELKRFIHSLAASQNNRLLSILRENCWQ